MKEVDVALTDFVLALQTFFLAWRVGRSSACPYMKNPFIILFLGFGAASLTGGVVHGFTERGTSAESALWFLTMLAVGVTGYGFALAGARLIWAEGGAGVARVILLAVLAAYAAVLCFHRAFLIAILFYVPATVMALLGFAAALRRQPDKRLAVGIAGLGLSLAAPIVQILEISLHPVYFTYNAVYHVILMAASGLFYVGVRVVLDREA